MKYYLPGFLHNLANTEEQDYKEVLRRVRLHVPTPTHAVPDWLFLMRMALALASSSAVTQRCLSTSEFAFKWYVLPPLESTMLHESSVSM